MSTYYVVRVKTDALPEVVHQAASHTDAVAYAAEMHARDAFVGEYRILLDTGSVVDTDLPQVLHHDPLLRYLFKLGGSTRAVERLAPL